MNGFNINISASAAWAPGLDDAAAWRAWPGKTLPLDDGSAPDIRFIDALLRRRLGRLSRMALHVANRVAAEWISLPTVFASRHGELSRTVSMLHALAAETSPSPAAFSLSVHNSAAGIFSIVRGDHAPSTALAAGDETLLWALLDATARLTDDPDSAILLVYADEPLATEYQSYSSASASAHALALLLRPGEGIHLEWTENRVRAPTPEPLSLTLLTHLLGQREKLTWHGERLSVDIHA
ncbi:MAG: beta-ketoacyl synthase chain length factor [Pseudomonadota bacterium]|nr:beta-ketoacyl synthase chain length factor [Pseudomonadota bacterium]MDP1903242.1 beta-ketoacyl synthase chain length factor [Pseudomonadota bacterium]MDP2352751.1 beta-ketoacyl synthase chain length factor [Pseudomonadota bacterium]